MIIVGSTALKYHGIDLRNGQESDLDFVLGDDPIFTLQDKIRFLEDMIGFSVDGVALPESIISEIPFVLGRIIINNRYGYNPNFKIATIDAVYTLKLSHLAWDIKWQKHKNDVLRLEHLGAKKIVSLYTKLVKYWESANKDKDHLNLYKKKSDFFDDYVEYVFDHDYLHKVVAEPDQPIYSLCLKDGQEVAIDKDKFDALPRDKQLRMFQEEITVIAAERWLIPERKIKIHWRKAYSLAVHKTITALTKGWATQFMIDNLSYYIKPDFNLIKKLYDKGIIHMEETLSSSEIEQLLLEIFNKSGLSDDENFEEETEFGSNMYYAVLREITEFEYEGSVFKQIECNGGEGMGDYASTIIQWNDKFYRFDYSYGSYAGFDFDGVDGRVVVPVVESVTVYK